MRSRLSLRAASPRALACAALLAGCGSSATQGNGVAAKTPVQIVAAARAAVAGAASVHVAGSIVSEGKPISLNMELVADKGGKGRVTLEGLSFRLVGVDDAVYVSGSAAFYKRLAGGVSARVLSGKWLKGAAAGAMASLAALTRLRTLLDSVLAAHGTLSRAPSRSIAGQPALGVRDIAGTGTLYVAGTGAPYPLEILERGASAGKLVFDDWNQPVSLSVPADAIDVKQLQSGR
jgi:hypothetical protein